MIWRLAPYLAVLALAAAVWWHGYSTGRDAERLEQFDRITDLESDLARISAANRAAAAQIEAMRAAQAALARELEDEARNDPDAVHRVPSGDSLRRLERRWRATP
jgi:hypothetical protein